MPKSNAPPETLTLDRLATPIGTALLVTDEAGVLRAFNWTDYEAAMRAWIGKHYPKAKLVEGRAPPPVRGAFETYFRGEARALETVAWAASGTPFQLKVWEALCGSGGATRVDDDQLRTGLEPVGHPQIQDRMAVRHVRADDEKQISAIEVGVRPGRAVCTE